MSVQSIRIVQSPTKDQYRKSSISRRSGTGTSSKKPARTPDCNPGSSQADRRPRQDRITPVPMDNSSLHDVRMNVLSPERPRSGTGKTRFSSPDKDIGSTPSQWWSQTGSNRRPPACKAGALPAELWPLLEMPFDIGPQIRQRRQARPGAGPHGPFCKPKWWARVDSNHRPYAYQAYALTT